MRRMLLVTTFRLCDIDRFSCTLGRWRKQAGVTVAALIDNDELDSKTREVERLNELVDIVTTYELNKKDESRRASGKNSPGVLDIIESMKKQKGYDYYTYVNADIELLTNLKRFNICEAIHEISNSKRVVFSHRRDYVLVPEIYHDYLQGLDLFSVPNSVLKKMILPKEIEFFRIGQVGWDYMLPLCLPKRQVAITNSLPIYHKVHRTGSNANWDLAISYCVSNMHRSWTDKKPIRRLIIKIASCFMHSTRDQSDSSRSSSLAARVSTHLITRIVFYAVLSHLFLDIRLKELPVSW